jgi:hypothetical protein
MLDEALVARLGIEQANEQAWALVLRRGFGLLVAVVEHVHLLEDLFVVQQEERGLAVGQHRVASVDRQQLALFELEVLDQLATVAEQLDPGLLERSRQEKLLVREKLFTQLFVRVSKLREGEGGSSRLRSGLAFGLAGWVRGHARMMLASSASV